MLADALSRLDTLLCFSHLRWNFVYQRPQHLLTRAAATFRTYYIEEPVYRSGLTAPTAERHPQPSGVVVVVPVLPEEMSREDALAAQRGVVDEIVEETPGSRRVLWYYTPMALQFSDHVAADLVV